MKKLITICCFLFSINSYGNGISVSNVNYSSTTNLLSFTITWENSWLFSGNPLLHDAAWIFIKYAPNGGDTWQHAEIIDSVSLAGYSQYISYDDLGIMIWKNSTGSETFGPVTLSLNLGPLDGSYQDFKVFATETVFIDQGDFYAGDITSAGRFYQDGNTSTPWLVDSEDAIVRGSGTGEFGQEGVMSGPNINANFPKGHDSFFCMKYKITARQYTDFLNCLTRTQQNTRTQADLSGIVASNKYVMTNTATVQDRNPIACDTDIGTGPIEFYLDMDPSNPPNSSNDGGDVVLNHLSVTDIIAYLDWSGMRPMTELEYEKICRGNVSAVAGEYAWGTDTWNPSGSITNSGTINESTSNVGILTSLYSTEPLRAGYSATATSGRTESSSAFYGVMDMHNLGEIIYGVGSANFSRFSYGDGNLSAQGNAVVTGWTVSAQLLSTQDPVTGGLEPISQGKNSVASHTIRSAHIGGRGVRRLLL